MGLSGVPFLDCTLSVVDTESANLSDARLINTRLEQWNAPEFRAARNTWQRVEITHSRFGASELFGSSLSSVRFERCKFGWLNLRASRLRDVEFVDCVIDELDLGEVEIERLQLRGRSVKTIDFAGAVMSNVDLTNADLGTIRGLENMRGTALTMDQAIELTEMFASHLGITII